MRRFAKAGIVLAAVFFFFQVPLFAGFPQTVTDDAGTQVVLKTKPVRILSFVLSADEILLDLVDTGRFAGINPITRSAYSNVADKVKGIKDSGQFSVEQAVAVQPDLVLVAPWSDAGKVAQVRKAGIPVYLLATPLDFAALRTQIGTLGVLVGEEKAAAALVARIDERLARVKARLAKVPAGVRKTVLDYQPAWGTSSGASTSWQEILTLAGLTNKAAGLVANEWGSVPMSKEIILQLDPDLLVLESDPEQAGKLAAEVLADPSLRGTKAVKSKGVVELAPRLKSTVSQYMVDAVEALFALAYPGY